MDPVQELIESVGQEQIDGGSDATPSTGAVPAIRRTKMVFIYSDEDVDGEGNDGTSSTTVKGVAKVVCDKHAIQLSEDALAELRADAQAIPERLNDMPDGSEDDTDEKAANGVGGLFFQEDVLSGLGAAASATGLPASLMKSSSSSLGSASTGRVQVREVDAPALWDGAFACPSATDKNRSGASGGGTELEMPTLLRRGLPVATFVLASRRKRFRDMEEGVAHKEQLAASSAPAAAIAQATSSSPSASAGEPSTVNAQLAEGEEADEEVVLEELDIQPVYEKDGKTVRALQTCGGYRLTLDERDLLENTDNDNGEEEEGNVQDAATEDMEQQTENLAEGEGGEDAGEATEDDFPGGSAAEDEGAQEDWDDFLCDDDEDEEEEEIDEAIVVAVVEQLVRCCEADDLDLQMSLEARRFTAAAKPLLEQLTEGAITPKEFGQNIDRDLRRFQRVYRSVYRPRDTPIIIDGVVMDM